MSKIPQVKIPVNFPMETTPDGWSVIKIDTSLIDDNEPFYKVFASWKGGYLDGDSYRFNSGITRVTEDENYFYFFGESGSCYKCHKKSYDRHSMWSLGILENVIETSKERDVKVEILSEETDWLNLIK